MRYIIGDVLLLLSSTSASDLRMGDEIEGFRVVAACLKSLGVTHMFGVVGIPVVEVYDFNIMLLIKKSNIKMINF